MTKGIKPNSIDDLLCLCPFIPFWRQIRAFHATANIDAQNVTGSVSVQLLGAERSCVGVGLETHISVLAGQDIVELLGWILRVAKPAMFLQQREITAIAILQRPLYGL